MHTVPYFYRPKDASAKVPRRSDPLSTNEGDEYYVEAIFKDCKKDNGFQLRDLMKGDTSNMLNGNQLKFLLPPMEL